MLSDEQEALAGLFPGDAVEIFITAQVDVAAHDRGRSIKGIIELVFGKHFECTAVFDHIHGALVTDKVNPVFSRGRRRIHLPHAFEPLLAVMLLAGLLIEDIKV